MLLWQVLSVLYALTTLEDIETEIRLLKGPPNKAEFKLTSHHGALPVPATTVKTLLPSKFVLLSCFQKNLMCYTYFTKKKQKQKINKF